MGWLCRWLNLTYYVVFALSGSVALLNNLSVIFYDCKWCINDNSLHQRKQDQIKKWERALCNFSLHNNSLRYACILFQRGPLFVPLTVLSSAHLLSHCLILSSFSIQIPFKYSIVTIYFIYLFCVFSDHRSLHPRSAFCMNQTVSSFWPPGSSGSLFFGVD